MRRAVAAQVLLLAITAAARCTRPLPLRLVPRGGANDDGDGAAVVEAAPRDVVEAPEEDRDGEVYLDVHFDPLKALASAARALRRALASLFGGGGKSASGASGSADAPSAVEAACPGALATAARAARRALATGRPVLVVAAPPASAAAEELAAAVKALGSDAVLLDATRTAQRRETPRRRDRESRVQRRE